MCLCKTSKRKVFTKDTYVIKGSYNRAFDSLFVSFFKDFLYIKDHLYKKSNWKSLCAFLHRNLNSTVFHTHSIERSKQIAEWYKESSYEKNKYGIFLIPKGTAYYEGNDYDFGVFSLSYYGLLTEENKHLILNQ
jgi:hypothetical protein